MFTTETPMADVLVEIAQATIDRCGGAGSTVHGGG